MDRLDVMRVFVTVGEERSFARAARRLSMSAPAVTRAVAALEERIGVPLLARTTRIVRPTEAGARLLEDAKRLLSDVADAEARAAGVHAAPRGPLTITAPLMFGRMHVAPIVLEFLASFPEVSARTVFVDHVVDMLEEGVDVAIRIGTLQDSSLRAVRVGQVRRVVCGAPSYLEKHGLPSAPEELARHQLIGFVGINAHRHWSFFENGKLISLSPEPKLTVNTADVAIQAALAGRGLTRLLSYQVEDELREGRLVRVLSKFEPPATPVHVLHSEARNAPTRVRAFVDLAARRLKALGLR